MKCDILSYFIQEFGPRTDLSEIPPNPNFATTLGLMKSMAKRSTAAAIFSDVERDLIVSVPAPKAGPNIQLMTAKTTIPGLQIPNITLSVGQRQVYIAEIPHDSRKRFAKFAKSVLIRALYRGEIHSAEEWCAVLAEDGVGTEIKKTNEIQPISESSFRAEWRDLAAQTYLPLISRADGERIGFGIARNRQQLEDHEAHLRSRAAKMEQQITRGFEILAGDGGWFAGDKSFEIKTQSWGSREGLELVIQELEKRPHTNGELALMLAYGTSISALEGGEPTINADSEESARYNSVKGGPIRELISQLRFAGVPVCAGSKGYWIAKDKTAYRDWLGRPHKVRDGDTEIVMNTGYQGRREAVLEHADRVPTVASLWFAESAAEREAAGKLKAGAPREFRLSVQGQERRRLRAEALRRNREQAAKEDGKVWLEQARAFVADRAGDYRAAKQRIEDYRVSQGATTAPSKADHTLKRKYENAQHVLQMKCPKQRKLKRGQRPAPWEREPETGAEIKMRGIKTATAASLSAKSGVDPCPF